MKIAVLGLGPSLRLFHPEDYDLVIGVNDIWKHYSSDIVVCVDLKSAFNENRLSIIESCRPLKFYSIFPTKEHPEVRDWSDREDIKVIELMPNLPDHICQLNLPQYPKSMCSPFVACGVAFKDYGATEIHLFGVDLIDHPHLKEDMCKRIKIHFKNMLVALRMSGSDLIVHGDGILKKL